MGSPQVPVPGFALLDGRVFGTSTAIVEAHASRLRAAGYGARLDLGPYAGDEVLEAPMDPTRFHFSGSGAFEMTRVLRACWELDAWLAERTRVVVHCPDGGGVTQGLLACYLSWRDGCEAVEAIRRVRASAEPAGFPDALPKDVEAFVYEWARKLDYLKT